MSILSGVCVLCVCVCVCVCLGVFADCLEVEISCDGISLFCYVNHFKAMNSGREESKPRRQEQVQYASVRTCCYLSDGRCVVLQVARVCQILDTQWKPL